MFKYIAVIVAVPIAAVLILAATKPDVFRVERTAIIHAPPEKIFPLINELHAFNSWNPYEKKDPNSKGTYSGPASGAGASYSFDGNRDVGKGSIAITGSSPSSMVTMSLIMLEPFRVHNTVEFTLRPEGESTSVTWAMKGPTPYLAKIIHVFVDMDRMVGRDFENGLANLRAIAER